MAKWKKLTSLFLIFPLLLTGCWDMKDIQDINYLTSIGIDYANDQYTVYGQLLDFSSVAKMESGKPLQPIPVWVGQGKGETTISAVNDLYRTSQMRIFFGQIIAVVVSENALRKGLKEIDELRHRYYEVRYTPWFFGTTEPLDQVFAVTPFFNLSPLISLLHQPQESYKQESVISPLTSREFVSDMYEPGKATLLPSLAISDRDWKKDRSRHSMLEMDGVFIFQDGKYQGRLGIESIPGLRWVEPKTQRSPLIIRSSGKPQVALSLENPKIKIIPQAKGNGVTYTVDVKLSGVVNEIIQPMSEQLMEEKAAEQVRNEIQKTFENGLEIHSDLLQLEHALYRQQNKDWKKIYSEGGFNLTTESLQEIKVSVKLNNAGKLKVP
ncbi:Ger(x)C family spore germination protein [Cohnella sp. REN36]|uniref:Ger(x)C family spore germination protein n=1 Tax=Cohnella sp. REN36 TaxID=2887347 RepID=UPI001D14C07A|nr:Ger(x)C family spore germination protein [Cohnella sp. REN36]MCC3372214.1 Ger(x)C family spore germination protein [Cohnella sp. REN36]